MARTKAQGSTVDTDERRSGVPRRWTDQDHDELIRHSEILRGMDNSLKNLLGGMGKLEAMYTNLDARMRAIENKDSNKDGYERGIMEAARAEAHSAASQRATIISLVVAALGLCGAILGPLIVKALSH